MAHPQAPPEHLSAADILSLVRDHLPAWMRACEAADTDAIALHAEEFGTTTTELLLFACAIKFAARKGKNVYVTCGQVNGLAEVVSAEHFIAVYREQPHSKSATATSPSKSERLARRDRA